MEIKQITSSPTCMRSLSSYLLLSVVRCDVERGVLGDGVHPPVGAALDQVGDDVAVTVLARLNKKEGIS